MAFPYLVQQGDTLHRIARRYGMNVTALYSANPQLHEQGYVYPGQLLHIPVMPVNRYVIQAGDSFADLARRFHVGLAELQAANPDADPRVLRIGQTLLIPISRGGKIVNTSYGYGYEELTEDLNRLRKAYPFLEITDIGKQCTGKADSCRTDRFGKAGNSL
ncbi:LysM peptidoglycan-binding domain-containing protein [Paenibacillus sp. P25]|nr:LysM peptidoglycan-binding domain-containing protein [Paenibacillus sp. P25]